MSTFSSGSIGHAKHRKSGVSPKSPKVRMKMQLDAQRSVNVNKPKSEMVSSIKDLFK